MIQETVNLDSIRPGSIIAHHLSGKPVEVAGVVLDQKHPIRSNSGKMVTAFKIYHYELYAGKQIRTSVRVPVDVKIGLIEF